jgi:hypothetical protein
VREICMLRSTRRGLETWHGRDDVTLADERATALIEPLRNVYGVSDKVLAMGLSDILIGAAAPELAGSGRAPDRRR